MADLTPQRAWGDSDGRALQFRAWLAPRGSFAQPLRVLGLDCRRALAWEVLTRCLVRLSNLS
jgi:hypothetical protein